MRDLSFVIAGLVFSVFCVESIACEKASIDLVARSTALKIALKVDHNISDERDVIHGVLREEVLAEAIHDLVKHVRNSHQIIRWLHDDLRDSDGISKSWVLFKELLSQNANYAKEFIEYVESYGEVQKNQIVNVIRTRVLQIPAERQRTEEARGHQRKNDPMWILGTQGAILCMPNKDAGRLFK